jgi:hypothetical protein
MVASVYFNQVSIQTYFLYNHLLKHRIKKGIHQIIKFKRDTSNYKIINQKFASMVILPEHNLHYLVNMELFIMNMEHRITSLHFLCMQKWIFQITHFPIFLSKWIFLSLTVKLILNFQTITLKQQFYQRLICITWWIWLGGEVEFYSLWASF